MVMYGGGDAMPDGILPAVYAEEDFREAGEKLAAGLGTDFLPFPDPEAERVLLVLGEKGLSLTDGRLEIRGDLSALLPRLKTANLRQELLVKAAKIKAAGEPPIAVDATAGLGEDSLLLAAAGFRVFLYEYDPVIAALLADAMERARKLPELEEALGRMELRCEDSISALPCLPFTPDVVLLDPMFPERQKSASVKKKFQLLHQLEKPCSDEEALLDAAFSSGAHKILIKRPVKGPLLAGRKVSYSLGGKAVRYDVIVQ